MDNLIAFGLFNIGFAGYLEFNQGTKGVLIRPDSNGHRQLHLLSYLNFIKQPIIGQPEIRYELWKWYNWDINYFASGGLFMLAYNLYIKFFSS